MAVRTDARPVPIFDVQDMLRGEGDMRPLDAEELSCFDRVGKNREQYISIEDSGGRKLVAFDPPAFLAMRNFRPSTMRFLLGGAESTDIVAMHPTAEASNAKDRIHINQMMARRFTKAGVFDGGQIRMDTRTDPWVHRMLVQGEHIPVSVCTRSRNALPATTGNGIQGEDDPEDPWHALHSVGTVSGEEGGVQMFHIHASRAGAHSISNFSLHEAMHLSRGDAATPDERSPVRHTHIADGEHASRGDDGALSGLLSEGRTQLFHGMRVIFPGKSRGGAAELRSPMGRVFDLCAIVLVPRRKTAHRLLHAIAREKGAPVEGEVRWFVLCGVEDSNDPRRDALTDDDLMLDALARTGDPHSETVIHALLLRADRRTDRFVVAPHSAICTRNVGVLHTDVHRFRPPRTTAPGEGLPENASHRQLENTLLHHWCAVSTGAHPPLDAMLHAESTAWIGAHVEEGGDAWSPPDTRAALSYASMKDVARRSDKRTLFSVPLIGGGRTTIAGTKDRPMELCARAAIVTIWGADCSPSASVVDASMMRSLGSAGTPFAAAVRRISSAMDVVISSGPSVLAFTDGRDTDIVVFITRAPEEVRHATRSLVFGMAMCGTVSSVRPVLPLRLPIAALLYLLSGRDESENAVGEMGRFTREAIEGLATDTIAGAHAVLHGGVHITEDLVEKACKALGALDPEAGGACAQHHIHICRAWAARLPDRKHIRFSEDVPAMLQMMISSRVTRGSTHGEETRTPVVVFVQCHVEFARDGSMALGGHLPPGTRSTTLMLAFDSDGAPWETHGDELVAVCRLRAPDTGRHEVPVNMDAVLEGCASIVPLAACMVFGWRDIAIRHPLQLDQPDAPPESEPCAAMLARSAATAENTHWATAFESHLAAPEWTRTSSSGKTDIFDIRGGWTLEFSPPAVLLKMRTLQSDARQDVHEDHEVETGLLEASANEPYIRALMDQRRRSGSSKSVHFHAEASWHPQARRGPRVLHMRKGGKFSLRALKGSGHGHVPLH